MLFFPAIDIKEGDCVRLVRGDMMQATIFNKSPEKQAKVFENEGAKCIHIIDLNGAFLGEPVNGSVISSILDTVNIPIQVGGGIRSLNTIEYWLSRGIRRVILGTIALSNPSLVREACRLYPGQISVGIDTKDGLVATEGWSKQSNLTADELAQKFEDTGVSTIIHTDIGRDGMMSGPNLGATLSLASKVSIPIVLSGGVSSVVDLKKILKEIKNKNIQLGGVISGRAIYEGKLKVGEATRLCEESDVC